MHGWLNNYLSGVRRVGFLGLGASCRSLLSMLGKDVLVTLRTDGVLDPSLIHEGCPVERIFESERALCDIDEQVLFLSPSVRRDRPELVSAVKKGTRLCSDHELFFEAVRAPVIAISGSSGKSTTAYLTAALINGGENKNGTVAPEGEIASGDDNIGKDPRCYKIASADDNIGKDPRCYKIASANDNIGKDPRCYKIASGEGKIEEAYHNRQVSTRKSESYAVLCGNIGKPMLESVTGSAGLYVAEMSSFMLMSHKAEVHRSAITNITENHLDWHRTFEEYKRAKLSLLSLSKEIVINADDPALSRFVGKNRRIFGVFSTRLPLFELLKHHKAKHYMTLESGFICHNGEKIIDTVPLVRNEEHNIANMMCALLLSEGYSKRSKIGEVLSAFCGLPHRCETVATEFGVSFINSSIDTTPERTRATLLPFKGSVVLLLGGHGKGLSYEPVISAAKGRVRLALCFGEDGEKIADALSGHINARYCGGFSEAVLEACALSKQGDTVLLSPACTSYDEFSSFEERGEKFKQIVLSYIGERKDKALDRQHEKED